MVSGKLPEKRLAFAAGQQLDYDGPWLSCGYVKIFIGLYRDIVEAQTGKNIDNEMETLE